MRGGAFVVLILATSWPTAATASDEPTPNVLLRQGAELFKQEDYEGARAAFARAYELEPKAGTLFNLALSELSSNHPVEAVTHFREYLTHAAEPAAKLESARTKWLPRAEARTARLDVFAPAAAEVSVDGVVQKRESVEAAAAQNANTPVASIVVSAAEHDVIARQGAMVETQHVAPRGGELVELHFQRMPDAQPPAATVSWNAGANSEEREGIETASRAKWITVIALGSGAIVAAGIGVGYAIASENKANYAAQLGNLLDGAHIGCHAASGPPACAQLGDAVSANRQYWAVSMVAYVGAGVLGAASVATWLLWGAEKPKALAVRPVFGARSASLEVGGDW
jgi:tetratricopeptide (TPR) repeat protein